MLTIKSLYVKSCRGILDGPLLEIGPGGLLIYGENGTGKSSFVDAIEMVLAGNCSSLDIGDQSVSWKKHGRHIKAEGDAHVELVLTNGNTDYSVTLETHRETLPREVRSYVSAACQQSFLLRRRTMLRFIDTKRSDRYKAVQNFLQLSRYEAFEKSLKTLQQSAENRSSAAQAEIERIGATLRHSLRVPEVPADEAAMLALLNPLLERVGLQTLSALHEAPSRQTEIEARLKSAGDVAAADRLRHLVQQLIALPPSPVLMDAGSNYVQARQACREQEAQLHGEFHPDVLRDGRTWIESEKRETCPLCEQAIDAAQTMSAIEARLQARAGLIERRDVQNRAARQWHTHLTSWHEAWRIIRATWSEATQSAWPDRADDAYNRCTDLVQNTADENAENAVAALYEQSWREVAGKLQTTVSTLLSNFGDPEALKQLWEAHNVLAAHNEYSIRIRAAQNEASHFATAAQQLKKLCSLAEKARKNAVQGLLDQVSSIADGYFQQIHPGESIGKPALQMNDRGATSMALSTNFHDEQGDPRGHYSEGHVDSLGLCLFLAVRRLHHSQQSALPLLVLDDVLHSVDGNHRLRTAELIFREFGDHQIIVTTHDPLWAANLQAASQRFLKNRKLTYRRIASWSLDSGPVWGDHLSDYEWLLSQSGQNAAPSQRIGRAGTLLEQLLQNLCHNLQAQVVFDIRGNYTLEPLWGGFRPQVKKNKVFQAQVEEIVEQIAATKWYRNSAGAHHNQWAAGVTKNDADEFVAPVIALREATYCSKCGEFIRKHKGVEGLWCCTKRCLQYDEQAK